MNRYFILLFGVLILLSCGAGNCSPESEGSGSAANETTGAETKLKNGDIVFQNSQSRQCKAIELATHSKYTHCGIIFWKDGQCQVLEAVQPVIYTPLDEWIERGKNKHYAVKRLKQSTLSDSTLKAMQIKGEQFLGKDYDIHFGWGDDRIYCSELVWKIYKQAANIEVGQLHKLKDFDLRGSEVKRIMKERYGNNIPYEEAVVSPSNIFDSKLLETVVE